MRNLSDIRQLLESDIKSNNQYIVDQLHSDVALINQISHYIIQSGGKRLRPLLLMLSAKALGYEGQRHVQAAAIIEFIHTATLLHDDVVDDSELRRGNQTANNTFGNSAAVLTGDFLYSRAFQMMVELDQMAIMQILADATNKIAEGEVLQLLNCHNADLLESQYMEVIYSKTAKLFEAACEVATVLANSQSSVSTAMQKYGRHLGNAFQIADDVLDFNSDSTTLGKNIGDDLAEGKTTLPLIYALELVKSSHDKTLIREAIKAGHHPKITEIIEIVKASGAIEKTIQKAKSEADLAKASLSPLTDSDYKNALFFLCELATTRTH